MQSRTRLSRVAGCACLLSIFVLRTVAADLAGLAEIRRDRFGVPHILAQTEEAAAFAQGYATAEDHLADLARLFLRARGAQASVFGKDFVDQDILVHQLRIWDTAESRFQELPPFMQFIVNGYAAGYNLYLTTHPSQAPKWATRITGVDVLAHCRAVLLIDFSLNLWLLDQVPQQQPPAGSMMWAIDNARSQSGSGILLANPHLDWSPAKLFHEVQLTVPGFINISGATFIGFPVVTIGFNENLGWTHTVNSHFSDTLYELTLDPKTHRSYLYEGVWLPLRSRIFRLRVKTERGIQVRSYTALDSHYGPVLRVVGNKGYAFNSPNLDLVNFLTQYNQMGKANSLQEFRSALNMEQLPMFNVGYTDRSGDVYYLYDGRLPIRPAGFDWSKPVPGSTIKTEWFSLYPIPQLPQLLNPRTGYVQNCNDSPWYANLEQRIDPKPYAEYIPEDDVTWRGRVSLHFLSTSGQLSLDAVKRFKYNDHLLIADRLKNDLIAWVKAHPAPNTPLSDAARVLENWDNHISPDSRGAELFGRWWDKYSKAANPQFAIPFSPADPLGTPTGLGDPPLGGNILAQVAEQMMQQYGTLDVPWGAIHRLRRGDFDSPIGGTKNTLANMVYNQDPDGKYTAFAGDTYVLAVEFTQPLTAYSVLVYSESSVPGSPHYNDQTKIYAARSFKRSWFSEQEIANNTERKYHPGEDHGAAAR